MNKNTIRWKKILKRIGIFLVATYLIACVFLYFFQEKMLFHPTELPTKHVFKFEGDFEEMTIRTADGEKLHGLLFHADSTKGLIFYLHGNGGTLESCGGIADTYTSRGYDIFMLDYRGYGKSTGFISSEEELFSDAQRAYSELKKNYSEAKTIIIGYSIGTGIATHLAANNHPKRLILQAPYYSMVDMMGSNYPIFPSFLLRYPLESNVHVKRCKMPIAAFHGDKDDSIPYESSVRLADENEHITLIKLPGKGHNGIEDDPVYQKALDEFLKY